MSALDAAYANIMIPEAALENLRELAHYYEPTTWTGPTGVDALQSAFRDGARMFLVTLEKRIAAAKSGRTTPVLKAVSATAEERHG